MFVQNIYSLELLKQVCFLLIFSVKPSQPVIKSHIVYNWENFTFTWNTSSTDDLDETKYTAWYKIP